jgi:nucleotide-binding universal stress UspA family protein
MITFKHILFPVDFSERCQAAIPFVTAMVKRCDAKLTLMHVVNLPAAWYGSIDAPYPIEFDIAAMAHSGEKRLNGYVPSADIPGVKTVVEHGDPVSLIVAFARENGVDLIMMPTHGYGMFRSLLLGSVTAKVLHDAPCAVWTAAHTNDPAEADSADVRSILCAIDLVPESIDLIRSAAALAGEFNARLRLVHAISAAEAEANKYPATEFSRILEQWAREQIAVLQERAGTTLEVCIEGGAVSSVVKSAALHHNADLIVMGRGRIHETFGRLRTNAYAIVRDSPCAVLSL